MDPILQFFEYHDLPVRHHTIARQYYVLVHYIAETTPRNPERTVAYRKLLESRDAALRALDFEQPEAPKDVN